MRLWWAATAGFAIVAAASCTLLVGENKDFHEVATGGGGVGGTVSSSSSSSSAATASSSSAATASSSSAATASSSSGAPTCTQDSDCGGASPCDVCPPAGKLCLAPLAPVASLADAGCKRVLPTCTSHPATCGPVGTFPVGVGPYAIAFDGTNMWVANSNEELDGGPGNGSPSVTVLAPDGGEVRKVILPDGSHPQAIAFDGTNMWVAAKDGEVFELSPHGDTIGVFDAGKNPKGIAFDGTNMWVTSFDDRSVTVLSPADAGPVATFEGVGQHPIGIAFDGTNMWVTDQAIDQDDGTVFVLPADGGSPRVVYDSDAGVSPTGIAFDGTNMWITDDRSSGMVFLLSADPSSMGAFVGYVSVSGLPDRIAFDGTNMWVAAFFGGKVGNFFGGNVVELSKDHTKLGTFPAGDSLGPIGIAFDGTHMWVVNFADNTVTEL